MPECHMFTEDNVKFGYVYQLSTPSYVYTHLNMLSSHVHIINIQGFIQYTKGCLKDKYLILKFPSFNAIKCH